MSGYTKQDVGDQSMSNAICPACGRRIQTVIPKGGDGSGIVFVRHKTSLKEPCAQGRMLHPMVESGREGLSLDDRSGLLDQTYLAMSDPPITGDKKMDGSNIHEFHSIRCFLMAMAMQARDSKIKHDKEWMDRLVKAENLAMGWNRGGCMETKRLSRAWRAEEKA